MISFRHISQKYNPRKLVSAAALFIILTQSAAIHADIREIDLRVGGEPVALNFSPSQTEYSVTVPHSGTLSFSGVPDNAADIVTVTFNDKSYTDHSIVALSTGESVLRYSVAADASASPKTYTIGLTAEREPLSTDFRSLTIFQIMVASFLHGEGGAPGYTDMWNSPEQRKDGNLRGVINALPYIKDLGMNAIWMTPIFDSSDNPDGDRIRATGYFCTNFFKIDPHFGTLDEFKELIEKAHALDIYVFLDCTFGHHGGVTGPSPSGNTISTSAESFAADNGGPTFAPTVLYPESLEYFKEVIRYWTSLGVDGWRLDAAYELGQKGHNYWEDLRGVELEECQKRREAGEKWGTLGFMVAEEWGNPSTLYSIREGGLNSVMDTWYNWRLGDLTDTWSVANLKNLAASDPTQRGYRPGVYPAAFLSNHDGPRIYNRLGAYRSRLRMAHAALVCNSQPIIHYYGDEFGDEIGKVEFPGAWDNCGRTSGHLEPRNIYEEASQKEIRQYYRLRAQYPALWRGDVSSTDLDDGFVVTKTDPETGQTIHVVFTFSDCDYTLPKPCIDLLSDEAVEGTVKISGYYPRFFFEQ